MITSDRGVCVKEFLLAYLGLVFDCPLVVTVAPTKPCTRHDSLANHSTCYILTSLAPATVMHCFALFYMKFSLDTLYHTKV